MEGVWSFGYGANMDMEALQGWKKVKVLEHCPAVLRGFKMVFSLPGLPFVEPGFGGLCRQDGDEVHGVAFKMDLESMAKPGVNKKPKKFKTVWHGFRGILKLSGRVNQAD